MSKVISKGITRTHTQKYFEFRKSHFANISLNTKSLNDSSEKQLNRNRYKDLLLYMTI